MFPGFYHGNYNGRVLAPAIAHWHTTTRAYGAVHQSCTTAWIATGSGGVHHLQCRSQNGEVDERTIAEVMEALSQ